MKFRVDKKGVLALKREPQMHVFVNAVGNIVGDAVPAFAPRRTGHYDASVEPSHMGFADARCRVYARDFKAWWIEFGAGPSPVRGGRSFPAREPLRNAARALGLDVRGVKER